MLPSFPPKLDLAHLPTPLVSTHSVDGSDATLWIKSDDLSGSVLSGNKVRKLEFLLADAKHKSADIVLTCGGLQSNHCRATAIACAQLGLRCALILRSDSNEAVSQSRMNLREGNLFLDSLSGAEIHVIPKREYLSDLEAVFKRIEQQYHSQGLKTYSIPTGGSNGLGVWGYLSAACELEKDFKKHDICPEYIVCAAGSAGTLAGLTLGCHLLGLSSKVIGFAVCDSESYFVDKVHADIQAWAGLVGIDETELNEIKKKLNFQVIDRYIGPGYARSYPELIHCIQSQAKKGLILDPVYTGKAFYGMQQELANGILSNAKNIVFVHTGGVFGLYPYAKEFLQE